MANRGYPLKMRMDNRPELVSLALAQCAEELRQWRDERKSLPSEMVTKQDQQLHDFYVRMIEIRRKAPATAE